MFDIDGAIKAVAGLFDDLITEPQKREEAKAKVLEIFKDWDQNAIALALADKRISGAKAYLLMVCVAAFALQYVAFPIVMWISYGFFDYPMPKPPVFDSSMYDMMLAGFGAGGLHLAQRYLDK